jgi:hypothetical protein
MVKYDISSDHVSKRSQTNFYEVQKAQRTWMWLLLILAYTGLGMMAVRHVYHQQSSEEHLLTLSSIIFVAVLLTLVAFLIYNTRLITSIDQQGISYTFQPLHMRKRFIAWQDIDEVYIREYDAISEYGGWGMKFGSQGKGYTVKGRYGLQLVTQDGRSILIGTQKPIELERLMLNLLYDYEVH